MSEKAKVLIVDDHDLVRRGLINLLKETSNKYDVDEASNGEEAISKTKDKDYAVILMDVTMPKIDGVKATKKILSKRPNNRILALSMHDDYSYISQMIDSGAVGYILKNASIEELLHAIETVMNGRKFFSGEISERIYRTSKKYERISKKYETVSQLTEREKQVFQLIVKGKTSNEVAEILNISKRTVDNHRKYILQKMRVKNSTELVKMAYEKNLVS